MCGIVGIVAGRDVAPLLLESLKRLEYRGYDSAGMAVLRNGAIERVRAEGKIVRLEERLAQTQLPGHTGIAHTRWATHGRPSERNAHPIMTSRVALVHNGIIENFAELQAEQGSVAYESDTDTESVAQLLTQYLEQGKSIEEAMPLVMDRIRGAFALAILIAGRPDILVAARRGSPLAIGYGEGEMYVGSDALALVPFTNRLCYLEEDDWVILHRDRAEIYNQGRLVNREIVYSMLSGAITGKDGYRHFMMKEIAEQSVVLGDALASAIDPASRQVALPGLDIDWKNIPRISMIGCGTAYLAGAVAKYWFERLASLPVDTEIASEYRYRQGPVDPQALAIVISQSGETIDSLAALRYARGKGQRIVGLLNNPESTIARESDAVLPVHAGPEIGVASTKAFTAQLLALLILAIQAGRARGTINAATETALVSALIEVPAQIAALVQRREEFATLAHALRDSQHALYLGRGLSYPLALEGALKLKELSYIHAEGYPAGEMKHGPIALIDETMPVIVLAPEDEWLEKTLANIQEVRARSGRAICFTSAQGARRLGDGVEHIVMPDVHPWVSPLLYAVPIQLVAYEAAVARGTDVDQPRNLAKSVTVE
jgi:glucosamine--fructose-6-phosphate aminotransferase (isomerizing)